MYLYRHTHSLIPTSQSGFRLGHSCETSLLKLYNDLILAFDQNKFSVLVCLDQSSAFDTVDHSLLLLVLKNVFNINGSSFPCHGLNHIYLIDLSMSLLIILHLFRQLLLMVYHKVLYLALYCLFLMFLSSQILFLLIISTHYSMQM